MKKTWIDKNKKRVVTNEENIVISTDSIYKFPINKKVTEEELIAQGFRLDFTFKDVDWINGIKDFSLETNENKIDCKNCEHYKSNPVNRSW